MTSAVETSFIRNKGAYNGAVRIVEAAIAQGIKRIVVTGSIVSLLDSQLTFNFCHSL